MRLSEDFLVAAQGTCWKKFVVLHMLSNYIWIGSFCFFTKN